jgi:salicylate hydroxylase
MASTRPSPPAHRPKSLTIGIIGGGPAGLGAAIALSALPDVKVTVYERAPELREFGAGIRIGYNCWRVLKLLGAAQDVKGHRKQQVLHRNGLTGRVLLTTDNTVNAGVAVPVEYQPLRVRRTRLQWALLRQVPADVIQLGKKLVSVRRMAEEGVKLAFSDGSEASVDLLVGADGIRSVVRESLFPDHSIRFTGTTIWRTLIPISWVRHIPDVSGGTSWWHGEAGHVYLSPVDDSDEKPEEERMFEISCRTLIDPATVSGKVFSWGVPVTDPTRIESHFKVSCSLANFDTF